MITEFATATVDLARNSHLPLRDAKDLFEFAYTKAVLTQYQGNRSKTAAALGVHRNTLLRRIDEMRARGYEIAPAEYGRPARRRR